MKLGLKEVQEREIVHVLINCCLQEKTFNPYYAFLGQKLCEFKHSHQVSPYSQLCVNVHLYYKIPLSGSSRVSICLCCNFKNLPANFCKYVHI